MLLTCEKLARKKGIMLELQWWGSDSMRELYRLKNVILLVYNNWISCKKCFSEYNLERARMFSFNFV